MTARLAARRRARAAALSCAVLAACTSVVVVLGSTGATAAESVSTGSTAQASPPSTAGSSVGASPITTGDGALSPLWTTLSRLLKEVIDLNSSRSNASADDDASAASTSRPSSTATSSPSLSSSPTSSTSSSTSTGSSSSATSSSTSTSSSSTAAGVAGTWLSGASGTGVADGSFGTWRGTDVAIAGTWDDSDAGQVALWQLHPGGEFESWNKPLDVAIGAIDNGETWSQAANGAYDARWTQALTNLKSVRDGKGTTYIRFAHEMNGDWYSWKVTTGDTANFIAAWKRFRALQQKIFPASKLVFAVNRQSSGGLDWTKTFPGAAYVDVLGVDSYNGWPTITSQAQWDAEVNSKASDGSPYGLGAFLAYAKSVGLPLAVPEWSGRASMADSAIFIKDMHDFFAANGGTGAGKLLYEIQFNCDMNSGEYMLYGSGAHMPVSAAEYVKDF